LLGGDQDNAIVIGDHSLADELRSHALQSASESTLFLQLIAHELRETAIPLGVLGGFVMVDDRLNVKMFGLMPIVGMARTLAIKHRITATSTAERLQQLISIKAINESDALDFHEHHQLLLTLLLEQQLADIADGLKPSARILPERLKKSMAKRLKAALKSIEVAKLMVSRV
jgi:CBS domain-containing protein